METVALEATDFKKNRQKKAPFGAFLLLDG